MNKTNVYLFQYSHAQLVMTFLKEIFYPYGTFGFAAHGLDIIVRTLFFTLIILLLSSCKTVGGFKGFDFNINLDGEIESAK